MLSESRTIGVTLRLSTVLTEAGDIDRFSDYEHYFTLLLVL